MTILLYFFTNLWYYNYVNINVAAKWQKGIIMSQTTEIKNIPPGTPGEPLDPRARKEERKDFYNYSDYCAAKRALER